MYEYVSRILCAARGIPKFVLKGGSATHRVVASHVGKCQGKRKDCCNIGHSKWQKAKRDRKDRTEWNNRQKRARREAEMCALQRPGFPLSTSVRGVPLGRTREEKDALEASADKSRLRGYARSSHPGAGVEESEGDDSHNIDPYVVDNEFSSEEGDASSNDDKEQHPFVDDAAVDDEADVLKAVGKTTSKGKSSGRARGTRVRPARDLDTHERQAGFLGSSYLFLLKRHNIEFEGGDTVDQNNDDEDDSDGEDEDSEGSDGENEDENDSDGEDEEKDSDGEDED